MVVTGNQILILITMAAPKSPQMIRESVEGNKTPFQERFVIQIE